jgi:TatD DNase family protein
MPATDKQLIKSGYIDTHFHSLEMEKKGLAKQATLARSFAEDLLLGVDIVVDAVDWPERVALACRFEQLYLTVGFSPAYVTKPDWEKATDKLKTLVTRELGNKDTKLLAVGEIGLDWYWKYGSKEEQEALFAGQLDGANACGLPVTIHNREADTDLLRVLKAHLPAKRGILHCFSSDYPMARQLVDLGFYISFAGNLTYKNAVNLQDAARRLPLDCLLLETDAPYLTPQPVRGETNRPGYVRYTYEYLAALRGLAVGKLQEQIKLNFARLFPRVPLFS